MVGTFDAGNKLNKNFRKLVREKLQLSQERSLVQLALKEAKYEAEDVLEGAESRFEREKKFFKGCVNNKAMHVNLRPYGLGNLSASDLNIIRGSLTLTV